MRQEWEKGCNFAYQSIFMPKASVSLLAALLTLCSCATQYDIAGNSSLDDVDGHMLYLRVAGSGMDRGECSIDSCKVVHGRFRFGGVVDSIVLAQVFVGNDAMLPVVIEDGELQISMGLAGPTVEGGQLNKRLYDFLKNSTAYRTNSGRPRMPASAPYGTTKATSPKRGAAEKTIGQTQPTD